MINDIHRQTDQADPRGYLHFSEKQNVSGNIIGIPQELLAGLENTLIRAPVAQAVVYGWYDNGVGSSVNILGEGICYIQMLEQNAGRRFGDPEKPLILFRAKRIRYFQAGKDKHFSQRGYGWMLREWAVEVTAHRFWSRSVIPFAKQENDDPDA